MLKLDRMTNVLDIDTSNGINAPGSLLRKTAGTAIPLGYSKGMEVIFEIRDSEEGGFYARALGYPIFTEGETWNDLRANVVEAVSLHFEDAANRPRLVQTPLLLAIHERDSRS